MQRDLDGYLRLTPPLGQGPSAGNENRLRVEWRLLAIQVLYERNNAALVAEVVMLVVAFVADHGYPFNEHGVDSHGFKLHNEDTHVPLLLKLPGRSGEVDQTVSTIDVFPTLARFVGLEVPEGIQGVSLLDDLDKRRALGAFSENTVRTRNHRSLVTHDASKLILAFDKGAHEVVHREDEKEVVGLFRSREDYGETRPIDDPAQIDELRARLWSIYDESLARNRLVTPAHAELDARTVEELERLGYVD